MKAITLIKKIDELATELVNNYTLEEVNEAFKKYSAKQEGSFNYITNNIYIPQDEEEDF